MQAPLKLVYIENKGYIVRSINCNKHTLNEVGLQEAKKSPSYKAENSSFMAHSLTKCSKRNNNHDRRGATCFQNTARVDFKL